MPYNNTPIHPPKEYTGSVSLPLARVKKIIHADDDIQSCSNNAAFVITIATEMFIQHLVEKTHEIIKAEKRPRRNVQYSDVANAVARLDSLEFLSDVVPRTTTYGKYQERQKRKQEAEAKAAIQSQTSPQQPSSITTPSMSNAPLPPPPPQFQPNGPFINGHPSAGPPHHAFAGPSSGSSAGTRQTPILLDTDGNAEPMDLDNRPASRPSHQMIPTTMEMLERARAAQARAEQGLSHSPSLPPPPHHPQQPGGSSGANPSS